MVGEDGDSIGADRGSLGSSECTSFIPLGNDFINLLLDLDSDVEARDMTGDSKLEMNS